jgi:hypothetical protein
MDLKTLARLGSGSLVLSLVLLSCDSADDTSAETGSTDCGVLVEETVPPADATDAYYRSAVEFYLSGADPEGDPTVTLAGPSGEISGTTTYSETKEVVVFTPSSPLEPSTDYAAKLETCSGETVLEFRTSDLGADLSADLDGRTFVLDLTTARFVEPPTIGALIANYLTLDILVGVVDAQPGKTLDMIGGTTVEASDPPVQNLCVPTFTFPQANFAAAPYFHVGPTDITVAVAGGSMTMHGLDVAGTFAPDGSAFGGGVLAGMIDARDLVGIFGKIKTADDFCTLTATFEAPCVACDYTGGDGAIYCLGLVADQILAPELPGTAIEVVDLENCHDGCKDTSGCL